MEKKIYYLNPVFEAKYWGGQALRDRYGYNPVSYTHLLRRKEFLFDFKLKSFVVRKDKLAVILKVGLPTAVQMAVVNISYLLITGMLNTFGVSVAAASGLSLIHI